jgi:hypothetical protein
VIHLYSGSGSHEIILGDGVPSHEWERRRGMAAGLLERRGERGAAELLRSLPFELHAGTNGFGDEFHVLYLSVPLEQYVELSRLAEERETKQRFTAIASVVTEIGPFIRFIALDVDPEGGPGPRAAAVARDHLRHSGTGTERRRAVDRDAGRDQRGRSCSYGSARVPQIPSG